MIPRILIVAGSDSGGGAGIQADIKTVTMLGGHAMTAITALTAQNTTGVQGVMPVPADFVVRQMRSCIDDIGVDAVKIGMIGSAETAHAVADVLEGLLSSPSPSGEGSGVGEISPRPSLAAFPTPTPPLKGRGFSVPVVFDPVMISTSGSVLADADTIAAFDRLMRLATLVTPNLPELEALVESLFPVRPERVEGLLFSSDAEKNSASTGSARTGEYLARATGAALLVKGGHGEGDTLTDRLVTADGEIAHWSNPRIDTRHTHGTGCTLASAIATGLGAGLPLVDAIERGIAFVRAALAHAPGLGAGHGPMGHALGLAPFDSLKNRDA
ncbi:bifunctional hydroxymethylpyrimidine kinase/phosphomethylpyrimidine kinase [Sphingomonas immobilis]|uniref:hydroxymethylpyrimidine kinase n=1 Tax=Sphingomonas immobilis TaxID=3063997 RepID=A0ABT9A1X7_9SPHN|nr:bifunctional hydroxymethylpyrimidine kinase/phosphomethylpyrimidine kinase [Sphingomonas sp. CA1-15]MDO7843837.1 bifunctional hydroxymethylpyrimidine kinase/phosphomethylpyrimidine kinase [Sphingomonas sp. CA1-15]